MKVYTLDQIIEEVRTKYDEHASINCEMITYPDDSDLENVIVSNIHAAYRFVVLNADLSMLEGKQIESTDSFIVDKELVGHIHLPNDFIRGLSFRLSSWKSSSSMVIEENSTEYRMQSDPYACGTYQNPVVALVHTSKGKELEFYKAKASDDTLRSFVYVSTLPIDYSEMNIPDMISDAFIYYVAALTATTFREDVANDFFKVAKSLLGKE